MTWNDGAVYEGDWNIGVAEGDAKFTFPNDEIY